MGVVLSRDGVVGWGDNEEGKMGNDDDDDDDEGGEVGGDDHGSEDGGVYRIPNATVNGKKFENPLVKKVLEQEPEMLPYHSSASPLSPQPSALGTPVIGPSIRVWDPYNVLAPPPPPPPSPPHFNRSFSWDAITDDRAVLELLLISHGEWDMSLKPDVIAGRCPGARLTPNGMRQARALAVLLNSQSVRFGAVYSSPLDRAQATALTVCQHVNFAEEHVQSVDALFEISHGDWEGGFLSELHTPEMLRLMEVLQPDFSPPNGESLRQVGYRMIQFLNRELMGLHEKFFTTQVAISDTSPSLSKRHGSRFGNSRRASRLRVVVSSVGNEEEIDGNSSSETIDGRPAGGVLIPSNNRVGIFTHSVPIKCLLTALLGGSPSMCDRICIDESSVTVIQHSWRRGWCVKRMNDTAHLRLL